MNYTIKAHPTKYAGTLFRSRLEARWAAFFDLAEWEWEYEPVDLVGWSPDFLVRYPCGHSDCPPKHELLIEVKPYTSLAEFAGHPCRRPGWECSGGIAAFGLSPAVTEWYMTCGSGGAIFRVDGVIPWWKEPWSVHQRPHGKVEALWREAGNRTQWRPDTARPCGRCGMHWHVSADCPDCGVVA